MLYVLRRVRHFLYVTRAAVRRHRFNRIYVNQKGRSRRNEGGSPPINILSKKSTGARVSPKTTPKSSRLCRFVKYFGPNTGEGAPSPSPSPCPNPLLGGLQLLLHRSPLPLHTENWENIGLMRTPLTLRTTPRQFLWSERMRYMSQAAAAAKTNTSLTELIIYCMHGKLGATGIDSMMSDAVQASQCISLTWVVAQCSG